MRRLQQPAARHEKASSLACWAVTVAAFVQVVLGYNQQDMMPSVVVSQTSIAASMFWPRRRASILAHRRKEDTAFAMGAKSCHESVCLRGGGPSNPGQEEVSDALAQVCALQQREDEVDVRTTLDMPL